MDRKELKQKSKLDLGGSLFKGLWLTAAGLSLIIFFSLLISSVGFVLNFFFIDLKIVDGIQLVLLIENEVLLLIFNLLGIMILLAALPLIFGFYSFSLKAARGEEAKFNNLLDGYKKGLVQNFLTLFIRELLILLWSLIPGVGIVKSLSYSMAGYLKIDHPEYDWHKALKESESLTYGHKWELFVLDLSFLGWELLGLLCLGVGVCWVLPYHETARANFYQKLIDSNPSYKQPENTPFQEN